MTHSYVDTSILGMAGGKAAVPAVGADTGPSGLLAALGLPAIALLAAAVFATCPIRFKSELNP